LDEFHYMESLGEMLEDERRTVFNWEEALDRAIDGALEMVAAERLEARTAIVRALRGRGAH
jgi:hypothetical protein